MAAAKTMNIVNIPINNLLEADYNPRQLSKKQFETLKDSLEKFGFVDPVIINNNPDRKNIIIGGHQRVKVAKQIGITEVPCFEINLTIDQEKELNVRLNKNTGDWDWDLLANNFDVENLLEWGFTEDELDFEAPEKEGKTADDQIPEEVEAICKEGDLWQLGEHRLLCGDATKEEDVELLMNGEKINLLYTDPPYGISVVSKKGNIGKGVIAKEGTYKKVLGDDKYFNPTYLFDIGEKQIIWGANYFHDKLPLGTVWIVWDKDRPDGTTFSDCELAWTNKKGVAVKKYKCVWNGMVREGESEKRVHPTQKPLKISTNIIKDYSNERDIVADLFLGSGSTLIACEKTNRKCYGLELDPKYCDVIIKRWEDYTGGKAKKIN